jgi:hypothetical protein
MVWRAYEISLMLAETCFIRTAGYMLPEHTRNEEIMRGIKIVQTEL